MSRENFVIKLSEKQEDKVVPVYINPSHIVSLHPTDAGMLACLSDGRVLKLNENQEQIQRKGAEHGVFKFTGG